MNQKKIYDAVDDYENPFTGGRFFGHEECYKEIENLRRFVLKLLNKSYT